jgi:hypothetical protein
MSAQKPQIKIRLADLYRNLDDALREDLIKIFPHISISEPLSILGIRLSDSKAEAEIDHPYYVRKFFLAYPDIYALYGKYCETLTLKSADNNGAPEILTELRQAILKQIDGFKKVGDEVLKNIWQIIDTVTAVRDAKKESKADGEQ